MKIKQSLDITDFKQMELLERKYYDEEFITPYHEAYNWYEKYSFSIIALEYKGEIAGFINLFPVTNQVFDQIISGTYNDRLLTADDIVDINGYIGDTISLFLSCVVIDESVRKLGALEMLLKSYIDFYRELEAKGIHIGKIVTDNVTLSGENFSRKIGFSKLLDSDHGSKIYVGTLELIDDYLSKCKTSKLNSCLVITDKII